MVWAWNMSRAEGTFGMNLFTCLGSVWLFTLLTAASAVFH